MFDKKLFFIIFFIFLLFVMFQLYFYIKLYNKNANLLKKIESFVNTLTKNNRKNRGRKSLS